MRLKLSCMFWGQIWGYFFTVRASRVMQLVKNPPAMRETWIWSLGWEDPLEEGKATHSSILAWRIPWTVWSMGSQRVRHKWLTFTSLQLSCDKIIRIVVCYANTYNHVSAARPLSLRLLLQTSPGWWGDGPLHQGRWQDSPKAPSRLTQKR